MFMNACRSGDDALHRHFSGARYAFEKSVDRMHSRCLFTTAQTVDVKPSTVKTMKSEALASDLLHKMNAYWRAANYLSVGQIYLYDNPLLREPLTLAHVKPLVVGHWGTVPGQNFIYVHLNRAIQKYDLNMLYVSGSGHGGAALVGHVYLEGTWSEVYPGVTQDLPGLKKTLQTVFVPGWHLQPRGAQHTGLHQRGW
jgi:phosphoketolase